MPFTTARTVTIGVVAALAVTLAAYAGTSLRSSSAGTPPAPAVSPAAAPSSTAVDGAPVAPPAAGAPAMTLAIKAGQTPQPGRFFSDIGYYAVSGRVTGVATGTEVQVYWYDSAARRWRWVTTTPTTADGSYAVHQLVGRAARLTFRATVGGPPDRAGAAYSNPVEVRVRKSTVTEKKPVETVGALDKPTVSGSVYPARAGVDVAVQVRRPDGTYVKAAGATTGRDGTYQVKLGYGLGHLRTYPVRTAYLAVNRAHWVHSGTYRIERVKTLDAVVTRTTKADVAETWRPGCPVGRSKLRTIHMNYYGFDGELHRGVLIIRSFLTSAITRSFGAALKAGFPIHQMDNPNVYAGKDKVQMAADNTSGFNCRRVVGAPQWQSPHSYGVAVDVNTVENPFHDNTGKWRPKNGRSFIDRSPHRRGMLTANSVLTRQLRRSGFTWGGGWSPGRDYQHFQHAH